MLLTVTQIDDLWNVGLLTKNISFLLIFFIFHYVVSDFSKFIYNNAKLTLSYLLPMTIYV